MKSPHEIEREFIEHLGEALSNTIEVPIASPCPVCSQAIENVYAIPWIQTYLWPEGDSRSPATCPNCGLHVEFYKTGSDEPGEEYAIEFTLPVPVKTITIHVDVKP